MRSLTLNFWPGLMLAILLRVGPGLAVLCYALGREDTFQYGFICGLGLAAALSGGVKLYRELRGV